MKNRRLTLMFGGLLALTGVAACSDEGGTGPNPTLTCGTLDLTFLADGGVGRDGIPALTDPDFVAVDHPTRTSYINDNARVIGVFIGDEWLAIPHNIMYQHEIVNLNRGADKIAVSYCPLTGSALGIDRASVDGAEFGVSGLLYQANLIMYDRNSPDESLWPQMFADARCGPREGQALDRHAVVEMTWAGWKEQHPSSRVIGLDPVDQDSYSFNPYGGAYEGENNPDYLGFPIPRVDNRRPPKERVLGLPGDGTQDPIAFPFRAMEGEGDYWVGEFSYKGEPAAVFFDTVKFAAVAVRPDVGGQALTFRVESDGIYDNETGSKWNVSGEATFGTHLGEALEVIPESYVAFWLAWTAFNNNTSLFIE